MKLKLLGYYTLIIALLGLYVTLAPFEWGGFVWENRTEQIIATIIYLPVLAYIYITLKALKQA